MASTSESKPTIGVLSIGEMGMGVAKLLLAHDYKVMTVGAGRSQATLDRIKKANITPLPSDEALVAESDIILSIVPPRDAVATAKRIQEGCKTATKARAERRGTSAVGQAPSLIYIDLNAISPRTTLSIAALFQKEEMTSKPSFTRTLSRTFSPKSEEDEPVPVPVTYLDGGIIGGPPSPQEDSTWKRPSIVLSGPSASTLLADLLSTLNTRIVSDEIGAASTLKACFASLTKGLTALSTLSYTTAHAAGVLPELKDHLKHFAPKILDIAEGTLVSMPPKAYRWVDEMRQIGETFSLVGGLEQGQKVYNAIGDIYKFVAEETVLGQETTEKRKRGKQAEDVAECMKEGVRAKKRKEAGEGKLDQAWRGLVVSSQTACTQERMHGTDNILYQREMFEMVFEFGEDAGGVGGGVREG